MTSSVARLRGGSSFSIAELIGDTDAGGTGNHSNDDNNNGGGEVRRCSLGVAVERDCSDIRQVDWKSQLTSGAFHIYRPSSVASGNFYQACLNWMRSRGRLRLSELLSF